MVIKPITSERDYQRALEEIDGLMDAKVNTPQSDRLDVLATLIVAWEEKHHAIEPPEKADELGRLS